MKKVLLTGASSGIGLETTRLLCDRGMTVWGTSRNVGRLSRFPNFHPFELDMNSPDVGRKIMATLLQEMGEIDVLINNAGAACFGPVESGSMKEEQEFFQLLVHAPMEIIRQVLPVMRKQGGGMIINVTSLAAQFPIPMMAAYSAAKAALGNFTCALRLELQETGIHLVELQPGDIQTPFNKNMRRASLPPDSIYKGTTEKIWKITEKNLQEAPSPRWVAETILRLIRKKNPPPLVMTGDLFQARIAPLGKRLLPSRVLNWALGKYYGF